MSPEVGDSRDDSRLFFVYVASPSTFSLLRLGRLVCAVEVVAYRCAITMQRADAAK